ncbi:MAG TPA: hypothetical protein DCY20_04695 [Firmicutes bacterium]|nr:hypothetical protein [Bacillota bacterium]
MSYIKAIDVLPLEIIEEIQKYTDGAIIYIPKKKEKKLAWGSRTDTKKNLSCRNLMIFQEFQEGLSHKELSQKYFLDIKSIQRIIRQMNLKNKF